MRFNLEKHDTFCSALKWLCTTVKWHLTLLHLSRSSGKQHRKATRTMIKKLVEMDPEAKKPELGIPPLFSMNEGELLDMEDVIDMLSLKDARPLDAPTGIKSELSAQIQKNLSRFGHHQRPLMESVGKYICERLRAIIDPCLDLQQKELAYTASPVKLELCKGPRKGQAVPFYSEERYLIAEAEYTIRARNARDDTRDYLVIHVEKEMQELEGCEISLLAYMGLVHRNRKERGEKNCVVYGMATDSFQFIFWKIDNNSQVTFSQTITINHVFSSMNDRDTVVSYLQHILTEVEYDCV